MASHEVKSPYKNTRKHSFIASKTVLFFMNMDQGALAYSPKK